MGGQVKRTPGARRTVAHRAGPAVGQAQAQGGSIAGQPPPEGWLVEPPAPDGAGVPEERPVDPAKSSNIQQVIAAARARQGATTAPISEKVSVGQDRERFQAALQRSVGPGSVLGPRGEPESQDDLPEPYEDGPEIFPAGGDLEGALEQLETLPEDEVAPPEFPLEDQPIEQLEAEVLGDLAGKPVARRAPARPAPMLPPNLQPRQAEEVIRDPTDPRARAQKVLAMTPRVAKGDTWRGPQPLEELDSARSDAGLQLPAKILTALEALLDCRIESPGDLLRAVSRITSVTVDGFAVELTPAERAEIARRAEFNRRTPQQEWEAAWQFAKPAVFNAMRALAGTTDISGKATR